MAIALGSRSVSRSPALSSTPATSVSRNSRAAPIAAAMAPAMVSALTLYVMPSAPLATGAITGTISAAINTSIRRRSTATGSPTKPRSTARSMLLSASRVVRVALTARTRPASLPQIPAARPPAALIQPTSSLLIDPASTISATCAVAASVTRKPSTNSDRIPSRPSIAPICGPPPWTTTGLMPHALSRTISSAKSRASSGSPIAWPPYLTTKICPA